MSLHDLLTWSIGIGCLLYFIVAIAKPAWFLYIPPEQRQAQAEQKQILLADRVSNSEQVKQAKGRTVETFVSLSASAKK